MPGMPRPRLHHPDDVLDHARALVLERGVRAATIEAIAAAGRVPVGSLYHEFASRDDLLARMWMRAARRSQAAFCAAADHPDPREAAVAMALSLFDFCVTDTGDARLLVSLRREDLLQTEPTADVFRELHELNRPIEQSVSRLARRLHGGAAREARDEVLFAVFDLAYGAVRRDLLAGRTPSRSRRRQLERAVRAVVAETPAMSRTRRQRDDIPRGGSR